MSKSTWFASAAMMALTLALPLVAAAQTGILHKRVPATHKPLPVTTAPAPGIPQAANASAGSVSIDAGGTVTSAPPVNCIVMPLPDGADSVPGSPPIAIMPGFPGGAPDGVVFQPLPVPMPMPTPLPCPAPIDGDGIVHILPIGPPTFVDGSTGPGIDGSAIASPMLGLDRAKGTPAAGAPGLQHATMATAMAAQRMPDATPPAPSAHAGGRGLPQRALGVRSQAVGTPASDTRGADGGAVAAVPISPVVSQMPKTQPPRWRDRFRFSSPFGRN